MECKIRQSIQIIWCCIVYLDYSSKVGIYMERVETALYNKSEVMSNNKTAPTVVGIDIGTFSTKLASVQRGAIDIITNEANFRETPTIVGFGDGERKIGEIGSVKLKSNFKNTVVSPTRFLGLKTLSEAGRREVETCTCDTKLEGNTLLFKVNTDGREEALTVEQILAAFMTKLSSIVEHNNLDEKLVMLSVPSCLTQMERRALLNAADISGLKNVKLVNESVAIGMDYGSFKKSQPGLTRNVLFLDFGHSKLSLSLIKFQDVNMEIVLERFNRNLGCRDIDEKIFSYMAAKFQDKKGLNIRENKRACVKLTEAIQKQRKILSGIAETDISIECLMEDQDFCEPLTRDIMHTAASETFDVITLLLANFKQEAQRLSIKIDSVELVGGGSRIPKFVEIAEKIFEMQPSRTTNSSETIAIGATLAAVKESGLFRFNTLNIVNRSALSLVLSWKSSEQQLKEYPPLNTTTILQFNQRIPIEKSVKIQTKKKTTFLISYDIVDDEVEKKLAEVTCEAPGDSNELTLTFKVGQDSFVTLISIKDSDGKDVQFDFKQLNCLSQQKIAAFREKQRQMFVRDFAIVRSYEKKNELQSFLYKQREALDKPDFKKYVTVEERQLVEKCINQMAETIHDEQNKMEIKAYEVKKAQVERQIKNLQDLIKKRKAELLAQIKELQKLKAYASDVIKQITQRYRSSRPVVETCEGIRQVYNWAEDMIQQIKKNGEQITTSRQIEEQYDTIKMLVDQLLNPQRRQQQQEQVRQQEMLRQRQQQQQLRKQKEQQQAKQKQRRQTMQREQEQEEEQGEPRHVHYEQHYDPQTANWQSRPDPYQSQRARHNPYQQQPMYNPYQQQSMRNPYQQQPMHNPQRPQQRRKPQQQPQNYDPFGMSRSGFFGPSANMWGNMSGFW